MNFKQIQIIIISASVGAILLISLIVFKAGAEFKTVFFTDVPSNSWYKKAVDRVIGSGIVQGYGDNTFRSASDLNRAELAAIIDRFLNFLKIPNSNELNGLTNFYPDLEKHSWYEPAVYNLAEKGIIQGYADGTFRPGDKATRAEVAVIIGRFLGFIKTFNLTIREETMQSQEVSFSDVTSGSWYERDVYRLAKQEIIFGYSDKTFRPANNINRAEFVAIIDRLLDMIEKESTNSQLPISQPTPPLTTQPPVTQPSTPPTTPALFDAEGRLTAYARSLAPPMYTLDLESLPKLYPEQYGNNYFEPGTYTVKVGDGFGKGDFLIKFVEFTIQEQPGDGKGNIRFEVFKKESDGNYYNFPIYDENIIAHYGFHDIFGMPIELPAHAWEVKADENILIYHPDCKVYFNYCSDENSEYRAENNNQCSWRCPFEATSAETKFQNGIYTVVFPKDYDELAIFSLKTLQQCYESDVDFLKYNPEKPRIGLKIRLSETDGPATANEEYMNFNVTQKILDEYYLVNLDSFKLKTDRCPRYMAMGHELTHILSTFLLPKNTGLVEGLAEFVSFQNGVTIEKICLADGWRYPEEKSVTKYARLSENSSNGQFSLGDYYATGFCFWQDVVKTYGYPNFVRFMQATYQKSRGIDDYYLLDVFKEVLGEPFSQEILDRYMLNKEGTFVEVCQNCEMFISK